MVYKQLHEYGPHYYYLFSRNFQYPGFGLMKINNLRQGSLADS